MTHLNTIERFGPTVQGEGPATGRRCLFLRLAGCDLACSWCDTPYSWDWTRFDRGAEVTREDADAVADWVVGSDVDLVVVTGGEPLLQHVGLAVVVDQVHARRPEVEFHVETNGRHGPMAGIALHVVSPKPPSSGDHGGRPTVVADVLVEHAKAAAWGRSVFKFVAADVHDLEWVDRIVTAVGIDPRHVWVMPEGVEPDQHLAHLRDLADHIVARGYNLATRLHLLAWGSDRGH